MVAKRVKGREEGEGDGGVFPNRSVAEAESSDGCAAQRACGPSEPKVGQGFGPTRVGLNIG
jgi:hypothetical protein